MDRIPIHGKYYDLRRFNHPGGKEILELCKDEPDCSALFESYHIFTDMSKIKLIMKKYEVGPTKQPSMFKFYDKGFYKTLQGRVRDHFKNTSTKWSPDYLWTIGTSSLLFGISQYTLFTSTNIVSKSISSVLSGFSMMSLLYNVLHDGSHYGISTNTSINNISSTIIQPFVLWNHRLWSYHHVIRHHQYTGILGYDPDIQNLEPYIRKSCKITPYKEELSSNYFIMKYILFNMFIPGLNLGQAKQYIQWILYGDLWNMKIPDTFGSFVDYLQYMVSLTYISLYSYYGGIMYLYLYLIGLNIMYLIGTAPDHDMYDTHIQSEKTKGPIDWGEMQVRHSGNYMSSYRLYTRYLGSINYQIEHHLFPSISNHRLPEIAPIVKQCCKEFNIPYVCVEDPIDVFYQVINTYRNVHNDKHN